MPYVMDYGGPVLAAPSVHPVVFPGDAMQADIAAFTAKLGASAYWPAIGHEYGVGALSAAPVVVADEAAPASIDDTHVQAWIASKITSGLLPAPDRETFFVIYYPPGTTVTSGAGTSCAEFYGYHGQGVSAQGAPYVYAVVPRCHDAYHPDLDNLTNTTSHELIEGSTNPDFSSAPAYATVDPAHAVWAVATGGSTEVGDMCALMPGAGYFRPSDLPYAVQRIWSNAAAAASHDPCVPAAPGAYFNAAPVLPDTITVFLDSGEKVTTQGVHVPLGQSRTIDVQLYSDGPTEGPWTIAPFDLAMLQNKPPALDLSLDAQSGSNGDVVHLTITPLQAGPGGLEAFYVANELGGRETLWVGLVSN
jgi:hypothetical protein